MPEVKQIQLSSGQMLLIDEEDWEKVRPYSIWVNESGYAMGTRYVSKGKVENVRIHRLVMGAKKGDPEIDHRDGNKLHCCKENLRFCTPSQNHMNKSSKRGTSSKYKGVSYASTRNSPKKWRATIFDGWKNKSIGYFLTENEAAKAYNDWALKLYGEFAKLNVIEEEETECR